MVLSSERGLEPLHLRPRAVCACMCTVKTHEQGRPSEYDGDSREGGGQRGEDGKQGERLMHGKLELRISQSQSARAKMLLPALLCAEHTTIPEASSFRVLVLS